jgi:hypothetical protein
METSFRSLDMDEEMFMSKKLMYLMVALLFSVSACATRFMPIGDSFPDRNALPNDSGIEGVQTFPDRSEYHAHVLSLEELESDIPPAFGAHLFAWQNCGIYDQPVEIGNALHSLEHGAVWLTYALDLSADQVDALKDIARGNDYVLMSPYPRQANPVVLTAWTVQLVIDSLPDERIETFIAYYANGPQNPEPGAACSGSLGAPIE